MKRFLSLAVLSLAALSSQAAAVISCNVTDTTANAVACFDGSGNTSGVFTPGVITQLTQFNATAGNVDIVNSVFSTFARPWFLVDESNSTAGTQTVKFLQDLTTKSGTLEFDLPMQGWFALVLKAGNGYSAYLHDGGFVGTSSIQYSISKNLSHASLFTFNQDTTFGDGCLGNTDACNPTPVPEPSSYALMFAGLGALIFVSRRRKQA